MQCTNRVSVPVGILVGLAVFGVVNQSGLKAQQVQPPLGTVLLDHWCWKQRVCRGIADEGECEAVGNYCRSLNCGSANVVDGCEWKYVWACVPSCGDRCTHIKPEEWGWDCGSACRWVTYNNCACACQDLGVNTFEAGFYSQCE